MKTNKSKYSKEEKTILTELFKVKQQLDIAQNRLDNITDSILIDSIIFEINSLHKKYEYYLQLCKQRGVVVNHFNKIS